MMPAVWKTGLTDEEVAAFYADQKSECENTEDLSHIPLQTLQLYR